MCEPLFPIYNATKQSTNAFRKAIQDDLAHHIDKDNHEILSAKLFYENETMEQFFTEEQKQIIKEAIEDHRASLE